MNRKQWAAWVFALLLTAVLMAAAAAAGSWHLGVGIAGLCLAVELVLGIARFGIARSLRVLAAHMLSHAEAMDSYRESRTASMHEWTARLGLRAAQTAFEERRAKELR